MESIVVPSSRPTRSVWNRGSVVSIVIGRNHGSEEDITSVTTHDVVLNQILGLRCETTSRDDRLWCRLAGTATSFRSAPETEYNNLYCVGFICSNVMYEILQLYKCFY